MVSKWIVLFYNINVHFFAINIFPLSVDVLLENVRNYDNFDCVTNCGFVFYKTSWTVIKNQVVYFIVK